MARTKILIDPVFMSVNTAAQLTSFSEEFIRKEIVEKRAIEVFKDTESDSQRSSVRFRASDFWGWFNKRFGVKDSA